jgi:hypothetical protein
VPDGGSGELGNGGVGWHQDRDEVFSKEVGQCLQAQGHEPSADALARRASAKQRAEAQLEAEIAALPRKAAVIDAQENQRFGKGKRGDELPIARSASAQR